jgi:hypothetical protein
MILLTQKAASYPGLSIEGEKMECNIGQDAICLPLSELFYFLEKGKLVKIYNK